MTETDHIADARTAELHSLAYALVANLFHYPDETLAWLLTSDERWHRLLNEGCVLEPRLAEAARAVQRAAQESLEGWQQPGATRLAELQAAYARLFGHAVRGQCPPYELEYGHRDIVQQAPELADVAGFYEAFGLLLRADAHDRPDHVSVEAEFLSVLAAKESHALAAGHTEALELYRDAYGRFLSDHFGRWVPAFAARVARAEPGGLFAAAAELAQTLAAADAERLGVEPTHRLLELAPADPAQDGGFECGAVDAGATQERFIPLNVEVS